MSIVPIPTVPILSIISWYSLAFCNWFCSAYPTIFQAKQLSHMTTLRPKIELIYSYQKILQAKASNFIIIFSGNNIQ